MLDFQTVAAILFLILITIFVYAKRKNLETKQIIPNIVYFSMYRTKLGLNLMDKLANKYRKSVIIIGYLGVIIGFIGMILISYLLVQSLVSLFIKPEAPAPVGFVLPFKAKGIFFVPFFYWIISIFVVAVVHEFAHGLIARAHNLKVKSSGFAFVGLIVPLIPAAFVEPDEKQLKKRTHKEQLSVFAAGAFSNIIIALVFLGIIVLISPVIDATLEPDGVKITDYVKGNKIYPAESYSIKIGEVIREVDGVPTPFVENLSKVLRSKKPDEIITIKTDKSEYRIKLEKNPENESLAYIGAYLEQSTKIKDNVKERYGRFFPNIMIWLLGLLIFLHILNLGIGLFNLVPIGPLDGGRMVQLVLHKLFGKEKGTRVWYNIGIFFGLIILIFIVISFYNLFADIINKIFMLGK